MIEQKTTLQLAFVIFAISCLSMTGVAQSSKQDGQGIEIYTKNPFYWQFDGEPTLLLGASDNDNLFQSAEVEPYRQEGDLPSDQQREHLRWSARSRLVSRRQRGQEEVLYFPAHGDISLDVPAGEYEMSKLCLETATWGTPETIRLPGKVTTETDDPQVILAVSK